MSSIYIESQVQSDSGLTYLQADLGLFLNKAATTENGTSFAINYDSILGTQVSDTALLQDGFTGGTNGTATVVNLAANSTHSFCISGTTATVDVQSVDASGDNVDSQSVYQVTANQATSEGTGTPPTVDLYSQVTNTTDADGNLLSTTAIANTYTSPDASGTLATQVTVVNDYTNGTSTTTTLDNCPNDGVNQCTINIETTSMDSPDTVIGQATEDTSLSGANTVTVSGDVAVPLVQLNNATVTISSNSSVSIPATGDNVSVGANASVGVTGTGNMIDPGNGDTIDSSGDIVNLYGVGTRVTVDGSGNAITLNSPNNGLWASDSTVTVAANTTDSGAVGNGNTINLGSGVGFGIDGSGNTVNAGSGNSDTLFGLNDTLTASHGAVALAGDVVDEDLIGTDESYDTNSGDTLGITGTGDTVNSSNDVVNFNGADDSATINGSGNTSTLFGVGDTLDASLGGQPL